MRDMFNDGIPTKPGFYLHRDLANTMVYWDGQQYTDLRLPAPPVPKTITFNEVFGAVFAASLLAMFVAYLVVRWFTVGF